MRCWNGWGEESTTYHLPESAAIYLGELIGSGQVIPDASIEETLASIPASRLPEHPLVNTDSLDRLMHARGQSLPDWVATRYGRINVFPDGVAYPTCDDETRSLIDYAQQYHLHLIPYGGGTSVVGHINPLPSETPALTVSLARQNQLTNLDQVSRLATFGAGVDGPRLEDQLKGHGFTLGHFPQSFELSTLGGWIATRSSGQQSYYYGRIEDAFAGGHLETPDGPLDLPALPASAAGPDLRQLVLGSEGRLGLITRGIIRIRSLPQVESFFGVFFHDWEAGVEAMRQIAQERIPISMARLSNPQETETTLVLSGKEELVAWADRGLKLLRYGPKRCLLIFGVTGDPAYTRLARRGTAAIARSHGGLYTGKMIGKLWEKSRFLTPYLRNTLWELGYAIDTLETAVPWSQVLGTQAGIQTAMHEAIAPTGERVLSFAHLSHIYRDGASIYVTYIFRRTSDSDETLERWKVLKAAASEVILQHGGTISHQHGVGLDHAQYLGAEKGSLGMKLLGEITHTLDPEGLLNPGKLLT